MTSAMIRTNDIEPITGETVEILVDGEPVVAAVGETLLATLTAIDRRAIGRNDHGHLMGACCGMGVCYCCVVKIDAVDKQRACQTLVRPGMRVVTRYNRHFSGYEAEPGYEAER